MTLDEIRALAASVLEQRDGARNPMLLAQIKFYAECESDKSAQFVMRNMARDCGLLLADHRLLAKSLIALLPYVEHKTSCCIYDRVSEGDGWVCDCGYDAALSGIEAP